MTKSPVQFFSRQNYPGGNHLPLSANMKRGMNDQKKQRKRRENVQVCIRERPLCAREIEQGDVRVLKIDPDDQGVEVKGVQSLNRSYSFDRVFGENATQVF